PKPVWGAMVGGLIDLQSITAAMMVFDMKRAATIAEGLQKRETYISNIARLPEPVRKGHGKVAEAATKLVAAAKSGEEQDVAKALSGVMQACNACHYDLRDAERRKKMK
ncbi:MAG: cytochrome c, partial [Alphaproteobacteria bacterium]|nr:cytochrome c [Alphaproteobacteria bacterium]